MSLEYLHESASKAYKDFGEPADNDKEEEVAFNTVYVSARYGLTKRINISATLPILDIDSTKRNKPSSSTPSFDEYSRVARGVGDLLLTGDIRFGTAPQVTFEAGIKAPTGSVDETDEFNQPLDPILQPGSGTTDFILGFGFWVPHVFANNMDLVGGVRHRIVPGRNKWGYEFGDQTLFNLHASKPLGNYRLGVRVTGLHSGQDKWFGNGHEERGATLLSAGPTLTWTISETASVSAQVQSPLYMHLTGSQLVDPATIGVSFNTDLTSFVHNVFSSGQEDELK